MKHKPVMLDFELKLEPIRELKRPPRQLKEGRVYLVPGSLNAQGDWGLDVIYLLCPCGCGYRLQLEDKAPHTMTATAFSGLTITPWIYVPTCKTRFIVAHSKIYGQCRFPPRETAKTARKEIFLKFGKRTTL